MPRYRVAARFGPWQVGEEFESVDPYHATMAAAGKLDELPALRQPAPPPTEEALSLLGEVRNGGDQET